MGTRAKAGTSLEALVKLAMPLLREAERQCPRTGPGAKPIIPDSIRWSVDYGGCAETKEDQVRPISFRNRQREPPPDSRPHRRKAVPPREARFSVGIDAVIGSLRRPSSGKGSKAIPWSRSSTPARSPGGQEPGSLPEVVRGTSTKRKRGRFPGIVDREAAWGYSEHHGWVYGYAEGEVVSCKRKNTVFPLLASRWEPGCARMVRTFAEKIDHLHPA